MIEYAIKKLYSKKYIISGVFLFIIFLGLYITLDYLNIRDNTDKVLTSWIIINVFINIVIALFSSILLNLSTIMLELKLPGDKASNLGFFSILFGILTYGCTSCVVIFFTSIGIAFSPSIFPLIDVYYGIIYKLISLLLVFIGLLLVLRNIKKGVCKIK